MKRNTKGSMLFVVVAMTIVIVIIGVACFFLTGLLLGTNETQQAVDSGSLNLARQVLKNPTIKVENNFAAVAEARTGGAYLNLNTVNRAVAQELLIEANFNAMENEQAALPIARDNVSDSRHELTKLTDRLAEMLSARANVISYFEEISNQNSVRMLKMTNLGKDIRIYENDFKCAFTDRGGITNVRVADSQFPQNKGGRSWNKNKDLWAKEIEGTYYLKGYVNDIDAGMGSLYCVPLKEGEDGSMQTIRTTQPHLISTHDLKRDADTGNLGWSKPIPNSFGVNLYTGGKYIDPLAMAWSASIIRSLKPRDGYYAQIPHGFIRIMNLPGQSAGPNVDTPQDDVFVMIAKQPVEYGMTTPKKHFEHVGDSYLDRIIQKNLQGQMPSASDCKALKKPSSVSEAMSIRSKSQKVDNYTYKQTLGIEKEIGEAYDKYVPKQGSPQQKQLHCLEAANYSILAARSTAGNPGSDPFQLNSGSSGIELFQSSRAVLSKQEAKFTSSPTMSELFPDQQKSFVAMRLKQRCFQIFPTFSGNLNDIAGWTTTRIPMGRRAFIYFDGKLEEETGELQGVLRLTLEGDSLLQQKAPWLNTLTAPDGSLSACDSKVVSVTPQGSLLDQNGDWGYPMPFASYDGDSLLARNLVMFAPSTGSDGLLGDIILMAQFGGSRVTDIYGNSPGLTYKDASQGALAFPKSLGFAKTSTYTGPD